MPRPKKSVLTPANAMRLIQILIEEGKILAQDVARYLHIAELEEKLRALRDLLGSEPATNRTSFEAEAGA